MFPIELHPQPYLGMLNESDQSLPNHSTIRIYQELSYLVHVFLLALLDPVKFLSIYLVFVVAVVLGLHNILLWDGDGRKSVAQLCLQVVNWPS